MRNTLCICLLLFSMSSPVSASVSLTFDAGTDGFGNVSWNTANGAVAWSPLHGGSLAITINTSGWTNPVAFLNMVGSPALQALFPEVLANGGALTFDYIIRQEDVVGYNPALPPDWFELVVIGNTDAGVGGGWDQNVVGGAAGYYGGIPQGYTTKQISLGIAAGAPVANNGVVTYGIGSGWNELMVGINSQTASFTGATFYIDNLTISSVPEPSSLMSLGLVGGAVLAFVRRRHSR